MPVIRKKNYFRRIYANKVRECPLKFKYILKIKIYFKKIL